MINFINLFYNKCKNLVLKYIIKYLVHHLMIFFFWFLIELQETVRLQMVYLVKWY